MASFSFVEDSWVFTTGGWIAGGMRTRELSDEISGFSYSIVQGTNPPVVTTSFLGSSNGTTAEYIERIYWGNGNVTDVMDVAGGGFWSFITLAGDTLPSLATTDEVRSFFLTSITQRQAIPSGAYAPGEWIDLASVAGGAHLNNQIENFVGTTSRVVFDAGIGNDWVAGSIFADSLWGGGGKDYISGASGDDKINSGRGDDWIVGGVGNDRLNGKGGSDEFVFGAADGNDVILRFQNDIDTLVFDNNLWAEFGNISVDTLLATFATNARVNGVNSIVFDFGDNETVTVQRVQFASLLSNDILIV